MATQVHKAGSWITTTYQVESDLSESEVREKIASNAPSGLQFRDMRVSQVEPDLSQIQSGQ